MIGPMRIKVRQLWVHLRSSFWFVPSAMIVTAALLAGTLVEVDSHFGLSLADGYPRIFGANADGARSILSGVASSMISIAGVTFSVTIVALSLASQQYTSRVLRNFMRDRANQFVLGAFLSIFIYCLIVLRTVRGEEESFIPSVSVASALALGIGGIGCLIFFIHHVATSIQASTIICNIAKETLPVVEALYPEELSGEDEDPAESERCARAHAWTEVPSRCTGYVQTVNYDGLMEWAEKNDAVVRMRRGIGEFAIEGQAILAVADRNGAEELDEAALTGCFSIASFRTIEQDPAFGIRQLVDISLKALSPGVNDTTTAVTCLNYLGAILRSLGGRRIPEEVCRRDGAVRLIARSRSYRSFVEEAFDAIRQAARSDVAVYVAMLEAIESAVDPRLNRGRRALLNRHAKRCREAAEEHVKDPEDRAPIESRFEGVARILGEPRRC